MEQQRPKLYLTKMSKAARKDRIFIDYLRNERGSTAIAPYSPRARAGAAVALPLDWADLKLPKRPVFQVADFDEWKERLARDPWKNFLKTHQRLLRVTPSGLRLFLVRMANFLPGRYDPQTADQFFELQPATEILNRFTGAPKY